MNRQDDYISIKDFAERAGVTRQTVYNKLDTILQKYVKVVKGKKSINTSALKLFDVKDFDNNVKDDLTDLTTDFTDIFSVLKGELEAKNKQLKDQAEQTKNQLVAKDKQIENLNDELKIKNIQISELNARLQESHYIAAKGQEPKQIEDIPELIRKKRSFWDRFKREKP